jgi:hypothetical protein
MSVLQPEAIRLLTEVGFLAGARGDLGCARAIFGALERCRPAAAFPYIGLAMAFLNRREHDAALRTLERGLKMADAGQVAELHAVRAFALHLAGRASEKSRAVEASAGHPLALALAAQPARPAT